MNRIKVAFFGTSDRSVPILNALHKDKTFELSLCVTKSDTVVGRHQEHRETQVKTWAIENHVMTIATPNLKGAQLGTLVEQFKTSEIEYAVVADFSFMIPYHLIEFFAGKLINIHFSLLPLYRGASPVQAAILNGDDTTGITYLLVDKKMDTGKIIHQIGYKMAGNETSGQLYSILFDLAAENLPYMLEQYHNGNLTPREQDESKATYTFSTSHKESTFIYKEDAQINWKATVKTIERLVRAYNPWPIAWTKLKELEGNKKLANPKIKLKPTVNSALKVKVYTASITENNLLMINELQIEGKNKMGWKAFENGYVTQTH